jgi:hypothetical protein
MTLWMLKAYATKPTAHKVTSQAALIHSFPTPIVRLWYIQKLDAEKLFIIC